MKVRHMAPNNWPLPFHTFPPLKKKKKKKKKSFPKQKPHFLTISHEPHKHCQASPLQVL